ncbi:MAG: type III polyketide synthase [Parachlamydiaceae bacterium]
MHPSIFALSGIVPPYVFNQQEIGSKLSDILKVPEEKRDFVSRIFLNSSINTRYSVVNDFNLPKKEWTFWGKAFPTKPPGMTQRNERYKQEAPLLAEEAARQAIQQWGGDPLQITHLISISCTGMIAPGIEFSLMKNLNLSTSINRIGINFMGCFGAFKGLSVAQAFAQANCEARILLVCTELCTLHLQSSHDWETLMSNALFGDGAAAAIIGGAPRDNEKPLWEIHRTSSLAIDDSFDKMSWEASDTGYLMTLSPSVPVYIKRHMKEFAKALLPEEITIDQCDWAIHPGGSSVIQAVEKALCLVEKQTHSSWRVLKDFGNMSSATFLFVLKDLTEQKSSQQWTAGLGFGPGLSAEGIFLRRIPYAH